MRVRIDGHVVHVHLKTDGDVDVRELTTDALVRASGSGRRTIEEKRQIVEETPTPGASVPVIARKYEVNANWYSAGDDCTTRDGEGYSRTRGLIEIRLPAGGIISI